MSTKTQKKNISESSNTSKNNHISNNTNDNHDWQQVKNRKGRQKVNKDGENKQAEDLTIEKDREFIISYEDINEYQHRWYKALGMKNVDKILENWNILIGDDLLRVIPLDFTTEKLKSHSQFTAKIIGPPIIGQKHIDIRERQSSSLSSKKQETQLLTKLK
ncbi:10695_t:CDS:2, partial [Diversispora eburnea]